MTSDQGDTVFGLQVGGLQFAFSSGLPPRI